MMIMHLTHKLVNVLIIVVKVDMKDLHHLTDIHAQNVMMDVKSV